MQQEQLTAQKTVIRTWYCLSPYGTFWITPAAAGVTLWLEDEAIGGYPAASAACHAVVQHRTGHHAWDVSMFDVPGLAGWGQLLQLAAA